MLAASPCYTARDPQHFGAAALRDADLLWGFIEVTQPKGRIKRPRCPHAAQAGHVTIKSFNNSI